MLEKLIKPKPNLKTDRIIPTSLLNKKYNITIENRNEIKIKNHQEYILIFTDGSKQQDGKTGYGITFSE